MGTLGGSCGVAIYMNGLQDVGSASMILLLLSTLFFAMLFAAALGADSRDFIIVFCGADVSEEERAACRRKMEKAFPSAEYYEIDGGQKVYDFIIVLQ